MTPIRRLRARLPARAEDLENRAGLLVGFASNSPLHSRCAAPRRTHVATLLASAAT